MKHIVSVTALLGIWVLPSAADSNVCTLESDKSCKTQGGHLLQVQRNAAKAESSSVEETSARQVQVRASIYQDGQEAMVEFAHEGRDYKYSLTAVSVYTDDAKIIFNGKTHSSQTRSRSRTFRGREQGRRASATVRGPHAVVGLFEVDGGVLQLTPMTRATDPSLLQAGSGMHLASAVQPEQLFSKRGDEKEECDEEGHCISKDPDPHSWGTHALTDSQLSSSTSDGTWNGVQWWGNSSSRCYTDDDNMHEFVIGVIIDAEAVRKFTADAAQAKVEEIITSSNFVYENQLHIRVKMGGLTIYDGEQTPDSPSYAYGCESGNEASGKLNQLVNAGGLPFYAVTHLFTGCGDGWGTVGVAYVGTICSGGSYNTGVNMIHATGWNSGGEWGTFAHELGHNFNGHHSFEEGQGNTGGIMDYGDGTLDGEYQFNTRYRRHAMCGTVNSKVDNCGGMFQRDVTVPTEPTPAPPPTPPPPTPPPTPTPPRHFFKVIDGDCTVDGEGCAMTPNYPNQYGHSESCTIGSWGALDDTVQIRVEDFNTERNYDKLLVNGNEFHGTAEQASGLNGVTPTTSLSWDSDYSVVGKGWKLCMTEGSAPTTSTSATTSSTTETATTSMIATTAPGTTNPPQAPAGPPGPPGRVGPPGPPGFPGPPR